MTLGMADRVAPGLISLIFGSSWEKAIAILPKCLCKTERIYDNPDADSHLPPIAHGYELCPILRIGMFIEKDGRGRGYDSGWSRMPLNHHFL